MNFTLGSLNIYFEVAMYMNSAFSQAEVWFIDYSCFCIRTTTIQAFSVQLL